MESSVYHAPDIVSGTLWRMFRVWKAMLTAPQTQMSTCCRHYIWTSIFRRSCQGARASVHGGPVVGGAVVPFAESRAHSSNATLWMPSQILAYTCIRSSHYLFTFCTHDAKNLALCTRDSKPFAHCTFWCILRCFWCGLGILSTLVGTLSCQVSF